MNRTRALVSVIPLVVVLVAAAAPPEKVRLRIRPKAGPAVHRKVTLTQRISLGSSGRTLLLQRTLAMALSFQVAEVKADGAAAVKGTYGSMVFIQTDMTGTITYDTENPTGEVPAAVRDLVPLVGKSFWMKISPEGEITEIEGVDEAIVHNIMAAYPDGPVGIGESWARRLSLAGGSAFDLDGTFTFRERREGRVVIDLLSDLKQKEGTAGIDFGGVLVGSVLRGTVAGPVEIEEATGWLAAARMQYRFSGTMAVGSNLQLPINVAAPIAGEGTLDIEPME